MSREPRDAILFGEIFAEVVVLPVCHWFVDVLEREHHPGFLASEGFAGVEGSWSLLLKFSLRLVEEGRFIIVQGVIGPVEGGARAGKGIYEELNLADVKGLSGEHVGKLGPFLLAGRVHLRQLRHEDSLDEGLEDVNNFTLAQVHLLLNIITIITPTIAITDYSSSARQPSS